MQSGFELYLSIIKQRVQRLSVIHIHGVIEPVTISRSASSGSSFTTGHHLSLSILLKLRSTNQALHVGEVVKMRHHTV